MFFKKSRNVCSVSDIDDQLSKLSLLTEHLSESGKFDHLTDKALKYCYKSLLIVNELLIEIERYYLKSEEKK